MMYEELKKRADKNYEDIEEILNYSDNSFVVWRYDTDSCYLMQVGSEDVLWQADTESILKILEDICDTWYISPRRRKRRIERIFEELGEELEELKREVEKP